MILKSRRAFERVQPSLDAKSFYIFCEGKDREPQYFRYFKEIDSKVNVEVIASEHNGDTSPTGLFARACEFIVSSESNPNPKFELLDIDEVWFVIDTDTWGPKIAELRSLCAQMGDWRIAQSNPCFELWLYYHFFDSLPNFEGMESSNIWKSFVDNKIPGGFDSRKHPILLQTAINNSLKHYNEKEGIPTLCSTQVHKLGENLFKLLEPKLTDTIGKVT